MTTLSPAPRPHPGGYYQHQDGGLYVITDMAKHSDDQSPLVIYRHLWPFTDQGTWARPLHEWASRFTQLSLGEVTRIMSGDAQAAQERISHARTARKSKIACEQCKALIQPATQEKAA